MKKIRVYYANYDLARYSNTLFKKAVFSLVLSSIAISLIVVGVNFGLHPFAQHLSAWQQSKSFISVDANVIHAGLIPISAYTTRKGHTYEDKRVSKTYQAKASFAYQYQGKKYISNHINLLPYDYDGRDSYPRLTFEELNSKLKSNETVKLWLNPRQPDYAVYDRSIIWPAFVLLVPFALAFPIAGVGLLLLALSLWKRTHPPSRPGGIYASRFLPTTPPKLISIAFAFLVFNLIMWPIAPNAWLYYAEDQSSLVKIFIVVWCAIGLIPLFHFVSAWKSRNRLGDISMLVQPPEGNFSKSLHGELQFSPPLGSRYEPADNTVAITLNLEYFGCYAGGKNPAFNFSSLWHSRDVVISAPLNALSQSFQLTFPEKITLMSHDRSAYLDFFWIINVEILGSIAQFKLDAHPNIPYIIPDTPKLH